jgi:hypothetical protein
MRRREIITLVGIAAAAGPLTARAATAMPTVGSLGATSPDRMTSLVVALRRELNEAGR